MSRVLSRRQFLQGAASAGVMAGVGGVAMNWGTVADLFRARDEQGARPGGAGVLVLVTLYGGNDGLRMVVPASDGTYRDARGDLAVAEADALPLSDGLFLHPALDGLKKRWDARQLAVVRGVGYPEPDRSHFRSMDIWQTGSRDASVATGWLGRWLDREGRDPLRAISIGPTLPRLLMGAELAGTAIPAGPLTLGGTAAQQRAYRDLVTGWPRDPTLAARVAGSGADLLRAAETVSGALAGAPDNGPGGASNLEGGDATDPAPATSGPTTSAPTGKGAKSAGALGAQLDLVAQLVAAAVPVRVYSVAMGGFDTHANEGPTHDKLMGELGAALSGFASRIDGVANGEDVVVVVYSEFGRRLTRNASAGTDHGKAGPVLVMGRKVKGGFYGDQPSLTDLDDGDLKANIDFRSVYTEALQGVLGSDATAALDKVYTPVGFL